MDEADLKKFEKELIENSDIFKDKYLGRSEPEPTQLFHFTSKEVSEIVCANQIMHASHIRSTSDPLEFALPMSACRDWFCLKKEFFAYTEFPFKLFKELSSEASFPKLIPYFISLCKNKESSHLRQGYGEGILQLDFSEKSLTTGAVLSLIKCRYVDDPYNEAQKLISNWRKESLQKTMEDNPKIDLSKSITGEYWYPTMMQVFFSISLYLKLSSFSDEEEYRLVVFTITPDQACAWYNPRSIKSASKHTLVQREYLPLVLGGIGITAKRI